MMFNLLLFVENLLVSSLRESFVVFSRLMSASKKECAKCAMSTGSLNGCSKCHLVSYCSRECQLSDWPKHKPSCKLDAAIVVFKSVCDHHTSSEKTDSEHIVQAVILSINYIFDELSGAEQENAIAAMIEKTKNQRLVKNDSNDLFDVALSCITLCLIYLKLSHFTDADIEIVRCSRYVKKIDDLMVNDEI